MSLYRNMGYINELFAFLLEVGYLADALLVCGVWGSQRGQWQGRRGTRQGRRTTLAQQDGHWGFSLWVTLMNFFVLVVCKWVPQGQSRLSPWSPRFPRPLGHPPEPSPSLVQVCRLFGNFFFVLLGNTCAQGPKQWFATPRATPEEYWSRKVRFRAPNQHFRWPIGGLVEHGIFGDIFRKVH